MAHLSYKSNLADYGLAGYGTAGGLLVPTSGNANPNVWILSSTTTPQPANKFGVWFDNSLWVDTNVWYD